ncbi:hypothetical protein [Bradyrhizobium ottawaense]|uniref:hypothetical protein n=1 Tax=Bradyrhizobium ottawaense TaxID=931866 RepID=UPI00117768A8|nr:hypothetical protein [Bradyrhizobium ottawaense]
MTGRAIAFILIVVITAFSQSLRAQAESLTFDPKLCKQGEHDKIYVSLGRYVFPTEYVKQGAVVYHPLLPHESRLALRVPNPEEPKGCFGNPLQSGSYALFTPAILSKGGQLASFASALQLLSLHSIDTTRQKPDTIWMGEASALGLAESVCKSPTVQEDLPNGMSVCRVRPNDPTIAQGEWSATYRAGPEIYTTPMNRPFVVNCHSGSGSRWPCDVTYEIMPHLGVTYRLFPQLNGNSAPIDHVIEIDKSIRATFAESIVKDYPWPAQAMDGR